MGMYEHVYVVVGKKIDTSNYEEEPFDLRTKLIEDSFPDDLPIELFEKFESTIDSTEAVVGYCIFNFSRISESSERIHGLDLISEYEKYRKRVENEMEDIDWVDGEVRLYSITSYR